MTDQATLAASPAVAECAPLADAAKLTTVTALVEAVCEPEHAVPEAEEHVNVVTARVGPFA